MAIQLMKKARRLYNEPEGLDYREKEDVADLLVQWATDVRAQNALDRQEREERLAERRALVLRLGAIQELCDRWADEHTEVIYSTAAEELQDVLGMWRSEQ